jgi:hypothetical protein
MLFVSRSYIRGDVSGVCTCTCIVGQDAPHSSAGAIGLGCVDFVSTLLNKSCQNKMTVITESTTLVPAPLPSIRSIGWYSWVSHLCFHSFCATGWRWCWSHVGWGCQGHARGVSRELQVNHLKGCSTVQPVAHDAREGRPHATHMTEHQLH